MVILSTCTARAGPSSALRRLPLTLRIPARSFSETISRSVDMSGRTLAEK